MNKKILAIVTGSILVACSATYFANLSSNQFLQNYADEKTYSITLDGTNAYVSGDTNTVYNASGYAINLAYTGATATSGKHVTLAADGELANTTQITGIKKVLVNYEGDLDLKLGLNGETYNTVSLETAVAWTADAVTYNYFALTATETTVIDSIEITYSCVEHISIDATISILEDGKATESGITYFTDNLPKFSATTNPADLAYEYWFSMNDGAVNLGQEVPTEPGTYAYNVRITEIGYKTELNSYFVWFRIAEGIKSTITITVAGEPTSNGKKYYTDALPDFGYTVDPVDAPVTAYYTANDGAINLGEEAPTEPGTYAYNVKVEGEGYVKTSAFVWYILEEAPTAEVVTPTIEFFYKGEFIDIAKNESHWICGGYVNSQFKASEFDIKDLTWEISHDLTGDVSFTLNDVEMDMTAPLTEGTYTLKVTVPASETNTKVSEYVLFVILPEGVEPTIEFFYKGVAVSNTGSGWFNGSYGTSKIAIGEFAVEDFTWTVTEGVEYTVSYTLSEVAIDEIDPTAAGSWCIKIETIENSDYIATSRYILFHLF